MEDEDEDGDDDKIILMVLNEIMIICRPWNNCHYDDSLMKWQMEILNHMDRIRQIIKKKKKKNKKLKSFFYIFCFEFLNF